MVKEKKSYQCGICNTNYESKEEATNCERRGKERTTFSIGTVLGHSPKTWGHNQPIGIITKIMGVTKSHDNKYEILYLKDPPKTSEIYFRNGGISEFHKYGHSNTSGIRRLSKSEIEKICREDAGFKSLMDWVKTWNKAKK